MCIGDSSFVFQTIKKKNKTLRNHKSILWQQQQQQQKSTIVINNIIKTHIKTNNIELEELLRFQFERYYPPAFQLS